MDIEQFTQDAIVTLEPIWVTDIIINTQSITNSGKIQYTINPEEADDKTVTFDANITSDYTIDAAGNVTINTDGCEFEVVARSQFGKDYTEVTGTKTITGYIRVAVKSITITTTTIQDAGQIQTSVSPENASIAKKEFELLSGSEYVEMDKTGYVLEVKSPGTFSVRVSGFDKSGNVVTDTREIICKTSDYFIAKTASGNKTGRGSWSNATDDIKTFDYDGSGVIELGNTYIETGKVCDVGENQLNLGGSIMGGCEFGTFVPKSNNDRSDISNISGNRGVDVSRTSAIFTNCDFCNISSSDFGVYVYQTSATITNCDFCNISGSRLGEGINVYSTSATITNCTFSAIESNDSNRYTSYYDLIKILPPETTGCRFLPEGKAQSIRFGNDCIINGKKVNDLLNS